MRHVLITESSLRGLLRELMNSFAPIHANPVVDPQAPETDPSNQNFTPTNKTELMSALRALVEPVADEDSAGIYVAVKDAVEEKEEEMKKPTDQTELAETIIRQAVRKILNEYFAIDPVTGEKVWKGAGPAPKMAPTATIQKVEPGKHGGEFEAQREKNVKSLQSKMASMQDDKEENSTPDLSSAFKVSKPDANLYMKIYNDTFAELTKENPEFEYSYVTESPLFSEKFKKEFLPVAEETFGTNNWRNYAIKLGKQIKDNLAKMTGKKHVAGETGMRDLAKELGVSISTINVIDATALAKLALERIAEETE